MADPGDLEALLTDRPDLESAAEAVLAVDEDAEPWTFEDVPVDTGAFGELVSRGIVEEGDDGGYRVADPGALRAVLERDGAEANDVDTGAAGATGSDTEDTSGGTGSLSARVPASLPEWRRLSPEIADGRSFDGLSAVAGAVAVVVLVVVTRALAYPAVFRDGWVLLRANDPYFYRYWVDQLLATSANPLALGTLVDPPPAVARGEPALFAVLWWVAALLGRSRSVAGAVLAWYPVVAAVGLAGLTYVVGRTIADDPRVGVAAAVILAVTPGHIARTGIGFADHHALDYLWTLGALAALVWVVTEPVDRSEQLLTTRGRRGAILLGIAVASQTLAWEGGPLLLFPVAGYLGVTVLLDAKAGQSPLQENAPVLVGLDIGGALALAGHVFLGWQSTAVIAAPVLLAVGGTGAVALCEAIVRWGGTARQVVGAEVAVLAIGFGTLSVVGEGILAEFSRGFGFLFAPSTIAETGSAFAPEELLGLSQFGAAIVLAVPFLVWATVRAATLNRGWLAIVTYSWYFFALSAFQIRFAAHLVPLVAVLAGFGFLWCLSWLDLTTPPAVFRGTGLGKTGDTHATDAGTHTGRTDAHVDGDGDDGMGSPTRSSTAPSADPAAWVDSEALTLRSGVAAAVLVVALVGTSAWFLPKTATAGTVDDRNYETAVWMADYADRQGWTYPDDYVLSRWGTNRMFNYVVNGHAASYAYARNHFPPFISSADTERWYERFRDRVGFVVLEPIPLRPNTNMQHLYVTYGSRWNQYDAVSHFRAVFASEDGGNKVFTLVPGARVVGRAPPNATVELRTDVEIPYDTFTYRTRVTANATGYYRAVVPYAGEYELRLNGTGTVSVPEDAVENGTRVRVGG